jgi:hypothetical protein
LFDIGTRTAVLSAFFLAGYDGPLEVLAPGDDDERLFVIEAEDLASLGDRARHLEQILTQLLHLKVAIIPASDEFEVVAFA